MSSEPTPTERRAAFAEVTCVGTRWPRSASSSLMWTAPISHTGGNVFWKSIQNIKLKTSLTARRFILKWPQLRPVCGTNSTDGSMRKTRRGRFWLCQGDKLSMHWKWQASWLVLSISPDLRIIWEKSKRAGDLGALTKSSLTRRTMTGWPAKEPHPVRFSTRTTKRIAGEIIISDKPFWGRVATIEAEIAPNKWNGSTTRTQTIEESLDESLLGMLIPMGQDSAASNVTDEVLKEALCRDLEAFDEIFEVDDFKNWPECFWMFMNIILYLWISFRWMTLTIGQNIALPSIRICAPCSMTGGLRILHPITGTTTICFPLWTHPVQLI